MARTRQTARRVPRGPPPPNDSSSSSSESEDDIDTTGSAVDAIDDSASETGSEKSVEDTEDDTVASGMQAFDQLQQDPTNDKAVQKAASKAIEKESVEIFRSNMRELLSVANAEKTIDQDQDFGADIAIQVKDHVFYAHRLILWTRSEFFKKFMKNSFLEKQVASSIGVPIFNLLEFTKPVQINPPIFRCILDYLYTGTLALSVENVFEVFEAASILGLDHAERLCSWYLKAATNADSVCGLLLSALKRNDEKFISICIKAIEKNTKQVLKSTVLEQMPRSFMFELVKNENICCSEKDLFDGLVKWYKANDGQNSTLSADQQLASFHEMAEYIRYPLMEPEELKQVEESNLVDPALLLEAFRFNACDDSDELAFAILKRPDRKSNIDKSLFSFRCVARGISNDVSIQWHWDSKHKNSKLTLSNHNLSVAHTNSSDHASIIGNVGFTSGVHVWKIRIDGTDAHWIGIGVVDKDKLTSNLQYDYDVFIGASSANQFYKTTGKLDKWNVGDVITVTLDLVKRVVKLHSINTDISGKLPKETKKWYPIVNLYQNNNKVTIVRV